MEKHCFFIFLSGCTSVFCILLICRLIVLSSENIVAFYFGELPVISWLAAEIVLEIFYKNFLKVYYLHDTNFFLFSAIQIICYSDFCYFFDFFCLFCQTERHVLNYVPSNTFFCSFLFIAVFIHILQMKIDFTPLNY